MPSPYFLFRLFLVLFLLPCIVPAAYAQKSSKHLLDAYRSDRANDELFLIRSPDTAPRGWKILKQIDSRHYIAQRVEGTTTQGPVIIGPANNFWKASDRLVAELVPARNKLLSIIIAARANWPAPAGLVLTGSTPQYKLYAAQLHPNRLDSLLQDERVLYAEQQRAAREELSISELDMSVNQVWAVGSVYPGITGKGVVLSVKEELFDTKDIDLAGRIIPSPSASGTSTSHAGLMATLAAGRGNSFIEGLGAAPGARLTSSDFKNLLPDEPLQLRSLGVGVQNHSYGTGIENYYGIEAREYDRQVMEQDTLVHVFSSGNSGNRAPVSGIYANMTGFANLTGTFKQAKNVLVVGGTNGIYQVEALSSKGPAYDGRIKPELVATGEDGTSGAAATTSGVVSLVKQAYRQRYATNAPSALLKAILINSADDLGAPGPDFSYGYGKLNALGAIAHIDNAQFHFSSLADQAEISIPVQVGAGQAELKLTVYWNDLPNTLNAPAALVNDIDCWLETPQGQRIEPWVLSSFPHPDSLAKAARRGSDHLNNAEQISLLQPQPGTYILHLKGSRVQGSQAVYTAYRTTPNQFFEWTYPLQNDGLIAGSLRRLRWSTTYTGTGALDISYDGGSSWQNLDNAVAHNNGYTDWKVPDHFGKMRLRMRIGNTDYTGPDFTVSEPRVVNVGYYCTDKLLLSWKAGRPGSSYRIYTLSGTDMKAIANVSDTVYKAAVSPGMSTYFAVAEVGAGVEGLRSRAIDITVQGTGCYVQTLLATVSPAKTVQLDLTIGTTIDLKSITWQKQTGLNSYTNLRSVNVIPGQTRYQFTDSRPRKGIQYYRVLLETAGGQIITSDLASAIVLGEMEFTFYPNPVADKFTIQNAKPEQFEWLLYDMTGRRVMTDTFRDLTNTVDISRLQPGVYILQIRQNDTILFNEKLIKQ